MGMELSAAISEITHPGNKKNNNTTFIRKTKKCFFSSIY